MKDWYRQLKLEYKVALWSALVISSAIILTIPCFFFSLMEIPQGIALGGGVGILTYLFLGLAENDEDQKKSMVITIVVIIVRFLVIAGVLFLAGWLYYAQGVKAFNIFAVIGAYIISIILNIILVRKEK
jgi:hypothetical protein